jgi:hypothetical protein
MCIQYLTGLVYNLIDIGSGVCMLVVTSNDPGYQYQALTVDQNCPLPSISSAYSSIRKGEELVVDYGEQYWRVVARALMIEQKDYAVRTMLQQERLLTQLEELLTSGKLSRDEYDAAVEWDVDFSTISVFEM